MQIKILITDPISDLGLDKLKDKTGYTKLKKKIPKGFSVGSNPFTDKDSMGFKLKF